MFSWKALPGQRSKRTRSENKPDRRWPQSVFENVRRSISTEIVHVLNMFSFRRGNVCIAENFILR